MWLLGREVTGFVALFHCFPGRLGHLIQLLTLLFFSLYRKKVKEKHKKSSSYPPPDHGHWSSRLLITHARDIATFPAASFPPPMSPTLPPVPSFYVGLFLTPDSSFTFRAAAAVAPQPLPPNTHTCTLPHTLSLPHKHIQGCHN